MNHIYISDLEDLDNIIDDIAVDKEDTLENEVTYTFFTSEKDETDFVDSCVELMYYYIENNPSAITEPDFHECMIESLKELMYDQFDCNENLYLETETKNKLECARQEICEFIDISSQLFYILCCPPRSFANTFIRQPPNVDKISKRIEYLNSIPQSPQRTQAWYLFRNKLITASSAYKIFESDSIRNQLIYEKCQPVHINSTTDDDDKQPVKISCVNVDSPLHHGNKYEPISIMLYEDIYETKIGEFGCIPHDTYSFIGASPDGINIDPSGSRYGRMLEIKNIVNREIDGIPKKEYFIQMQLQMEVCDLDETDFLETRFVEYENETQFYKDGTFFETEIGERKGIIIYFSSKTGSPQYMYKPLHMNFYEFYLWEQELIEKHKDTLTWIKNIYWRLDEISCVLVLRNKKWFNDNVCNIKDLWDIILKERVTGSDHRAPTKRVKKHTFVNDEGCLLLNILQRSKNKELL